MGYEVKDGDVAIIISPDVEDGEWTGGCYATYDNLVEKVKEALGGSND